jgi:hypothetical protein
LRPGNAQFVLILCGKIADLRINRLHFSQLPIQAVPGKISRTDEFIVARFLIV